GTAELGDDDLSDLWVCLRNLYRILQSLFIIPHISASSFLPWPWLVDPVPAFSAGLVCGVNGQRSVGCRVFFQRMVPLMAHFTEIGKCLLVTRVCVKIKLHFVNRETD